MGGIRGVGGFFSLLNKGTSQWLSISFLKLKDVKGEAKDAEHAGEIDVLSLFVGHDAVRLDPSGQRLGRAARSMCRT